jgi:cell division protein FtsL
MRHTTLLFLLIAGAISIALFSVKYQVQELEDDLRSLNRSITMEWQSIHVLNAEWSHLNNPERLRKLARWHLGMQPIDPAQMTNFKGMERLKLAPRLRTKVISSVVVPPTYSDGQAKP